MKYPAATYLVSYNSGTSFIEVYFYTTGSQYNDRNVSTVSSASNATSVLQDRFNKNTDTRSILHSRNKNKQNKESSRKRHHHFDFQESNESTTTEDSKQFRSQQNACGLFPQVRSHILI